MNSTANCLLRLQLLSSSRFLNIRFYRFSIKMRAFIILIVTILFHHGSGIIYSIPQKDANLEIPWDDISIHDLQFSFSDKNKETLKTISKLNEKFVRILMSYHDLQKLIRQSFKSSQLLTEDIDLGTKNLWVLQDEAPISYVKYYMTLDCQLKPESVLHQIYKAQINGVQIHYNLTLSYTIQTNGTRTRVYLTKPMEIVVRRSPGGVINTTFSYQQSPTVQIYSQSKTENPQIDDNKLNSIITQLKPKMTEYLEKIFPSISQIEDIEIFNNSSDVTYSNFQRPNLYIIPDSKVINKSNYQLPQCIVENLKKDIGEITNTNFFILTELLSNFSSAETQGNFTSFNNMHLMTEIKVENPLRGIILWEFSSKQNSKDYSVKFNFTIDHL